VRISLSLLIGNQNPNHSLQAQEQTIVYTYWSTSFNQINTILRAMKFFGKNNSDQERLTGASKRPRHKFDFMHVVFRVGEETRQRLKVSFYTFILFKNLVLKSLSLIGTSIWGKLISCVSVMESIPKLLSSVDLSDIVPLTKILINCIFSETIII